MFLFGLILGFVGGMLFIAWMVVEKTKLYDLTRIDNRIEWRKRDA